jgi:hypothetical protein
MTASRRDPHLGELAAALVDGALDHNARDRALAHVMRCDGCRAEVDAQRRLKAMLTGFGTPSVPDTLTERLLTLPDRTAAESSAGLPPVRFEARFRADARVGVESAAPGDRLLTTGGADRGGSLRVVPPPPMAPPGMARAVDRPLSTRPVTAVAGRRGPGRVARRRRRIAATAAGGLAAFALSLTTVAVIGADDRPVPPVSPQVGRLILEHDRNTDGLPGKDPEAGVVDATSTGR